MVSTMATHSHPVGRIIELLGTISTMKSKCETLVMALSELALLWQIFASDRRNWIPESDFQ
jgi:hypothetical protein